MWWSPWRKGGASGGLACAPFAHKIYLAIQEREQERSRKPPSKFQTLAEMQ